MSKKTVPLIILIIVIIVSVVPLLRSNPAALPPPEPTDGVLDLSSWSFQDDGIVRLEGEWSFYFNRFLTHEDFERGVDIQPTPVQIPSTKKSMSGAKPFSEDSFYGTMRLVVKLPEAASNYALRSDIILTSFRLFIDGEPQGDVGTVGTSPEESVPYYDVLTTYFSPETNQVELIYHTSDFTAKDGAIAAPELGLANQIARQAQMGLGRDLFLFGMLLIMGIYHFGLYFMRPIDRAPMYFSIFCLLFAFRMLLVGERFLPSQLVIDFLIYGRLAYLCVFLGFTALCGFLYHTLSGLFKKWFIKVSILLGGLFGFLILWFPYPWANGLLIAFAVFGFALLIFALVRMVTGALKGYLYAGTVLLGIALLAVTFINDMIYEITLSNTPSLIPLGVAVFTLTQAYTLSAKFSNAFTRAEQLSAQNDTILQELKHVNSNLEALVKERTYDLQVALEEMELMSKTDYLTKLPNRRLALLKIDKLISMKKSFYVALVDIDHFKDINDRFGHVKGDEVLVRLSAILRTTVADCGTVSRWGGEEFLMILEVDADSIIDKADEIRAAVATQWHEDIGKNITITMGLCQYKDHYSIDVVIANADKALYQGKVGGRNCCIMAQ